MENGIAPIQRPFLDLSAASHLLQQFYGYRVLEIKELISFTDQNFLVTIDESKQVGNGANQMQTDQFILKIYNSKDSLDGNRIELAVNTMAYLWNKGYCCPFPVTNLFGKLSRLEKVYQDKSPPSAPDSRGRYGVFSVVLLTFVPGKQLNTLGPVPASVFVDIGMHLAKLHQLLEEALTGSIEDEINLQRLVKDFDEYERNEPSTCSSGEWSLVRLTGQRHLLDLIEDSDLRKDVEKVIDLFDQHVLPLLPQFKQGLIHGDFNDQNIIVSQKQPNISQDSPTKTHDQCELMGIIDFGEVAYTYIICDIAITVSELMRTDAEKCFETGARLLSGYRSMRQISEVERSCLYYLVMARDAQMIMLCLDAKKKDPTNDYIMESFADSCHQLQKLVRMQKSDVESLWNV